MSEPPKDDTKWFDFGPWVITARNWSRPRVRLSMYVNFLVMMLGGGMVFAWLLGSPDRYAVLGAILVAMPLVVIAIFGNRGQQDTTKR